MYTSVKWRGIQVTQSSELHAAHAFIRPKRVVMLCVIVPGCYKYIKTNITTGEKVCATYFRQLVKFSASFSKLSQLAIDSGGPASYICKHKIVCHRGAPRLPPAISLHEHLVGDYCGCTLAVPRDCPRKINFVRGGKLGK